MTLSLLRCHWGGTRLSFLGVFIGGGAQLVLALFCLYLSCVYPRMVSSLKTYPLTRSEMVEAFGASPFNGAVANPTSVFRQLGWWGAATLSV